MDINLYLMKKFKDLYDHTLEREKIITQSISPITGKPYKLITIWESDWDNMNID